MAGSLSEDYERWLSSLKEVVDGRGNEKAVREKMKAGVSHDVIDYFQNSPAPITVCVAEALQGSKGYSFYHQ